MQSSVKPKIKKKSKQAKAVSESMKKIWNDPVRRAELCEKLRQSALKRKYTAKGYAVLQRRMREKVNIPEHYENRDQGYTQKEKFKEKSRKMGLNNRKVKKIIKRPNDFAGVLTESEMARM